MYKLMIVDDEENITDNLYEIFQNRFDMELSVYKAYSAHEAIEILKKVRIDVILSDIHMPGMNGIELLEEVRDKWPWCRFIFLTGYTEFDDVYSAIQYKGIKYILKTESFKKIKESVKESIQNIENEMQEKKLLNKAKKNIKRANEIRKRDYFIRLINDKIGSMGISESEFRELDIDLDIEEPVLLMLGKIDDLNEKESYSNKSLLTYTVQLIVDEYLNENIKYTYFIDNNMDMVWVIQPTKLGEDSWENEITYIRESLELIQTNAVQTIDFSVSFILDDSPVKWTEVSKRYHILEMFLSFRIGKGKGMLITNKYYMKKEVEEYEKDKYAEKNQYMLNTLKRSLENLQKDNFFNTLSELTNILIKMQRKQFFPAHELYNSIALVFLSYINKWGIVDKTGSKLDLLKLLNANRHKDWKEAAKYLENLGEIIFELQDTEQKERTLSIIKKVEDHIDENIGNADEITLIRLSEVVHFNQSYLSRLFKQVAGINISEYISKARMDKTKKLLEKREMRIKDIAESVGFSSSTNFARFFKKYAGVTPQEYRDTLI